MLALECLLTIKDLVGIIRLSKSKLYALVEQGILPAVRLPGVDRVLVAPSDLQAYIASGRQLAAAN